MKKPNLQTINYGISKNENKLLKLIKENNLVTFSLKELARLTKNKKRTKNLLSQLKKKNIVKQLKRNCYTLKEYLEEHLFQIAIETIKPSYISFWTALSYYGFTEQQPVTIQLITTKKQKNIENPKIITTKIKKERFFAYTKIHNFIIAEKEKAIIDSLAYPEKAGGLKEVIKCLKNAWPELNKKLLIKYLKNYNNKSLNARIGYILEQLELKKIKVTIPETYILLDKNKPKKQKRNKKWRIIINNDI